MRYKENKRPSSSSLGLSEKLYQCKAMSIRTLFWEIEIVYIRLGVSEFIHWLGFNN